MGIAAELAPGMGIEPLSPTASTGSQVQLTIVTTSALLRLTFSAHFSFPQFQASSSVSSMVLPVFEHLSVAECGHFLFRHPLDPL